MRCSPSIVALLLSVGAHAVLITMHDPTPTASVASVLAKPRLLFPARIMGAELVRARATPDAASGEPVPPLEQPMTNETSIAGNAAVGALDADPAQLAAPPRYFSSNDIDQRPVPATVIDLDAVIGVTATTGRAVVRFWISRTGTVDQVDIEQTTFDNHVTARLQRYAEQLLFIPGQVRGVPVPGTFRIEVNLEDEEQRADSHQPS